MFPYIEISVNNLLETIPAIYEYKNNATLIRYETTGIKIFLTVIHENCEK